MYVSLAQDFEDISVGRSSLISMQLFEDKAPVVVSKEVEKEIKATIPVEKTVVPTDNSTRMLVPLFAVLFVLIAGVVFCCFCFRREKLKVNRVEALPLESNESTVPGAPSA